MQGKEYCDRNLPYFVRTLFLFLFFFPADSYFLIGTRFWLTSQLAIWSIANIHLFQRLTSSMPMHPLPAVMNHGVPVTLCSDDPSAFGNMGLSYDFFQASHNLPHLPAMSHIQYRYSLQAKPTVYTPWVAWPETASRSAIGSLFS